MNATLRPLAGRVGALLLAVLVACTPPPPGSETDSGDSAAGGPVVELRDGAGHPSGPNAAQADGDDQPDFEDTAAPDTAAGPEFIDEEAMEFTAVGTCGVGAATDGELFRSRAGFDPITTTICGGGDDCWIRNADSDTFDADGPGGNPAKASFDELYCRCSGSDSCKGATPPAGFTYDPDGGGPLTSTSTKWTSTGGFDLNDCEDRILGANGTGPNADDGINFQPFAAEIWYDGFDYNCDFKNDYDQDLDTYVRTVNNGQAGGTAPNTNDCNDNPAVATGPVVTALTGANINPGVSAGNDDIYDGIDENCSSAGNGQPEFDKDNDGQYCTASVNSNCTAAATFYTHTAQDCVDDAVNQNALAPKIKVITEPSGPASPVTGCQTDEDVDGFGDSTPLTFTGLVAGNDCDDALSTGVNTFPGAAQIESASSCRKDNDNDGYGDNATGQAFTAGTDCMDSDNTVFAGAPQLCDGVNNNCSSTSPTWPTLIAEEIDNDGDHYVDCKFNPSTPTITIANWKDPTTQPTLLGDRDCMDTGTGAATIFLPASGSNENCDGYHNNCSTWTGTAWPSAFVSGLTANISNSIVSGETGAAGREVDDDDDAYVECSLDVSIGSWGNQAAETPDVAGGGDCVDSGTNAIFIFPGSASLDTVAGTSACTKDVDGDEWGDNTTGQAYTAGGDCVDSGTNAIFIFRGAASNETSGSTLCQKDVDGDNWGDKTTGQAYTAGTDCLDGGQDTDGTVYPSAPQICDGINNVCSGLNVGSIPSNEIDDDGDLRVDCKFNASSPTVTTANWKNPAQQPTLVGDQDCQDSGTNSGTIYSGAPELCDGFHNNCDTRTAGSGGAWPLVAGTTSSFTSNLTAAMSNTVVGGTGTTGREVDDDDDTFVECTFSSGVTTGNWGNQTAENPDVAAGGDCVDTGDANAIFIFPGAASIESSTACMKDVDNDNYGDKLTGQLYTAGTDCYDVAGQESQRTYPRTTTTPVPNVNPTPPGTYESTAGCYTDEDLDGYGDSAPVTGGGITIAVGTDCLDSGTNAAARNPGHTEDCDGFANQCAGGGVTPGVEVDNDTDGQVECDRTATVPPWLGGGTAPTGLDCLDSDSSVKQGATQLCDGVNNVCTTGSNVLPALLSNEIDDDGDGYVDCKFSGVITKDTWKAGALSGGDQDCDDVRPQTRPGATETCDGYQNNCSNQDGDWTGPFTSGKAPNYTHSTMLAEVDNDDDGWVECNLAVAASAWGNPAESSATFPAVAFPVVGGLDCLDTGTNSNKIFPGAAPNETGGATACMKDVDNDNYGDNSSGQVYAQGTDCLDDGANGPFAFPLNPEVCDGIDNNCASGVPANEVDGDTDGFVICDRTGVTWRAGGTTPGGLDCKDDDSTVRPTGNGVTQICDGINNICSGGTVQALAANEIDNDGDGYVDCVFTAPITKDTWKAGPLAGGDQDCNDGKPAIYVGAPELCDGYHNNCTNYTGSWTAPFTNGKVAALPGIEVDNDDDSFVECTLDVLIGDWGNQTAEAPFPVTAGADCDDSASTGRHAYPGAAEDETPASACMRDVDLDGWGQETGSLNGATAGHDCNDAASSCTNDCGDDDTDGQMDCARDRCFDVDEDNYGTVTDAQFIGSNSDVAVNACTTNGTTPCTQLDASCTGFPDCNDAASSCTNTCTGDADSDGTVDCLDGCGDVDQDSFGSNRSAVVVGANAAAIGSCKTDGQLSCVLGDPICTVVDCDDTRSSCTDACGTDADIDGVKDCIDLCADVDEDNYGVNRATAVTGTNAVAVGQCTTDGSTPCPIADAECISTDCLDSASSCTTDCATDADTDGSIDCRDLCSDLDHDNFGGDRTTVSIGDNAAAVGSCKTDGQTNCVALDPVCTSVDCDDTSPTAAFTFPGSAENEDDLTPVPSNLCMRDRDGDGWGDMNPPAGVGAGRDCVDDPTNTSNVSLITNQVITAVNIRPTIPRSRTSNEVWYDGVDQNCFEFNDAIAGNDSDFDQDGDTYDCRLSPSLPTCSEFGPDCLDSGTATRDPGSAGGGTTISAFTIHPGTGSRTNNEAFYDGVDQNCLGDNDYDWDGDGYTCNGTLVTACAHKPGSVGNDCYDNLDTPKPPTVVMTPALPSVPAAEINIVGVETYYDGIDENCDGLNDFDQDLDDYIAKSHPLNNTVTFGFEKTTTDAPNTGDCVDDPAGQLTQPAGVPIQGNQIKPNGSETPYDGVDQNCDGLNDNDYDGDGFIACGNPLLGFGINDDDDSDGALDDCDCSDTPTGTGGIAGANIMPTTGSGSSARKPEAYYNGIDENCDGKSDYDKDGDTYDCDPTSPNGPVQCPTAPSVPIGLGDCNDEPGLAGDQFYPGRPEACEGSVAANQRDNDCDGNVNTEEGRYFSDNQQLGLDARPYWYDGDQDGSGVENPTTYLCARSLEPEPSYYVSDNTDCDDADETINPAAPETCDNKDNNCNDEKVGSPGTELEFAL